MIWPTEKDRYKDWNKGDQKHNNNDDDDGLGTMMMMTRSDVWCFKEIFKGIWLTWREWMTAMQTNYQQEICYQGCTDEGSNNDHFFCI